MASRIDDRGRLLGRRGVGDSHDGGPAATVRSVGVRNMRANTACIIAPSPTGILVDRTGSFRVPFAIAAAMALSSGIF